MSVLCATSAASESLWLLRPQAHPARHPAHIQPQLTFFTSYGWIYESRPTFRAPAHPTPSSPPSTQSRLAPELTTRHPVSVIAPLGSNPAPFTELIWALAHGRDHHVAAATVIVEPAGYQWLCQELLVPGGPWDQLRAALGDRCPAWDTVDLRVSTSPQTYDTTVWTAAQDTLSTAGPCPIVFALSAGRTRTMTAAATVIFQLLARPIDTLVDVRVSDRRVEGGAGFFFPAQTSSLLIDGAPIAPDTVDIELVEVTVPRLRGFLAGTPLDTWQQAVDAGQAMLDQTTPPRLHIDLHAGHITADGTPLKLSHARTALYAALASVRAAEPRDGGWLEATRYEPLRLVLERSGPWVEATRTKWMDVLRTTGEQTNQEAAAKLRSTVGTALRQLTASHPTWRPLVPEQRRADGVRASRLPLPPEYITIVG